MDLVIILIHMIIIVLKIKYTHKIANNSEWIISCKLNNEYTKMIHLLMNHIIIYILQKQIKLIIVFKTL